MWTLTLAIALAVSSTAYLVLLGIYRVFYSPLAKFPGPRLAGLTTWYQGYYDIWLRGQYFRKIDNLHATYGPIVRINPHELHINDPEFIDELFAGSGKRRDKDKWIGRSIQLPDSTVATIPHDHHRSRRAPLNPYFSKASIRRLEPVITEILDNLLGRLDACARSGEIMPLSAAYKAVTSDIITGYCFGESTGFLMRDDYNSPFFDAVAENFGLAWWMTHIAWLGPLLNAIPMSVQEMLMPGLKSLFRMQRRWVDQIEEIRSSDSSDQKRETIFYGILNSDLPDKEKTTHRMRQEAQVLVQAGQDTTATTLSSLTFHLLANPRIVQKLREELAAAFPNASLHPISAELEQLPYLSAIIQEGLRLHPGTTMRLQRISPDEPLVYHDPSTNQKWVIPAGTSVSMDALSISMNANIFPEPQTFLPERWMGNSRLERYLLTFSKGTRMCAGINLAYAELYIILAGVFRRYDLYDEAAEQKTPTLALFETTRERDVDISFDLLVPFPMRGSKGVRAIVR